MGEHSKGPWSIDSNGDIVAGPYNVCIPYATKPDDKQLMAASPTLLEALEKLANWAVVTGAADERLAEVKAARAAIALATGKDR